MSIPVEESLTAHSLGDNTNPTPGLFDFMATDIVRSTREYEEWLRNVTDVQKRALAAKHGFMSAGPFSLLRATFYRWVQLWEKLCPELNGRDDDVFLVVGDLHIENFGMWLDSRRRQVWGINDFDEACEIPFTSDLVRMATSAALAAEENKIDAPLGTICQLLLDGYRDGLKAGGAPILVESGHHELNQLASAAKPPKQFWNHKLDEEQNPKIRANELPPQLEAIFRSCFCRTCRPEHRRERNPGGVGSLGRRRFTAILSKGKDRQAREAKALVPSGLYWCHDQRKMPSQTGTLLQRAIRCPDPYLQVYDQWLVRRMAPDTFKMDLPYSRDHRRLALAPALLRLTGMETANVHLGSRTPDQLMVLLEKLTRKPGAKWLEHATEQMVKATKKDHKDWKKHSGSRSAGA